MGQSIEALMKTTLENIKNMIDVNTVIGDPVETLDGTVIIPVSKVYLGFVSGGGDINQINDCNQKDNNQPIPFAGGGGAGFSLQPVGFLSISNGNIRLVSMNSNTTLDRIIDLIPGLIDNCFEDSENNRDEES